MTTFLNKIKIKNAIKNTIKTMKEKFETQTSLLEKKNIHCSIDKEEVDCDEMNAPSYIGVPAPMYLEDDPWFGSAPMKTEKQIDYMKQEFEMKRQEREEQFLVTGESEDIHQKMYEIATKNQNTTLNLNPIGGSENFHEGPGGWNSGTGMGQFKK
jgi:hypothetical protein